MTAEEQLLFRHRKAVPRKLLDFGFAQNADGFSYEAEILNGQFSMMVTVTENGQIETALLDIVSGEPYVLHQVPGASGAYVGMVREAHGALLRQIAEQCFEMDVFQSPCTKQICMYIRQVYGDELEYLWPRTPENAVWRRKDTGKWYGALLIISRRKLGLDSDELVEILDLRIPTEEVDATVDGSRYFPGFHMNKRHWYTICLDGSVPPEEIYPQIQRSYHMAYK